MKYPPLGTVQEMKIIKNEDHGFILKNNQGEVFLPYEDSESNLKLDDIVSVFIYQDKNDRITATLHIPEVGLDTYGWAKVTECIKGLGVFVNIGIQKDILVSSDDLPLFQTTWPKPDDYLYVKLGKDKKGRLLALPATESTFMQIRELPPDTLLNETVEGYVYRTSKEGTAIFTHDGYRGFIHHTERENEPRLGEYVKGRVIEVKEDSTINVSLLPFKHERIDIDGEKIISYLKENNGEMSFHDKSNPEEIKETFQMSKSAFKRALGRLLKWNIVEMQDNKTMLKK